MSQKPAVNLSVAVIITAHQEGILSWPAYRSAAASAAAARSAGHHIHICVVLDSADQETARLAQQALDFGLVQQIEICDVKDPGQSRLVGIRSTDSDLVAIMDSDDLFSTDWLTAAIALWQSGDGRDIIHPEWRAFFGGHWSWQRFIPQTTPNWQIHQQAFVFDYSSAAVATRRAWTDCPFQPARVGSGFGHEDWHWGLETIAAGYRHIVAPGEIRFYRYREGSVCRQHDQLKALLRPSKFFDLPAYRDVPQTIRQIVKRSQPRPSKLRDYLSRTGRLWRGAIIATIDPIRRRLSPHRRRLISHPGAEEQMLKKWYEAAKIEPILASPWVDPAKIPLTPIPHRPHHEIIALPRVLNDWDAAVAVAGGPITHAIFVPWIMQSGADRVAADYFRAIRLTGGRPAILITERPLIEPGVLPTDAPVIDLSHLQQLSQADRLFVIARLLLQRQPEHTLLINSPAGWETVGQFAPAITAYTKVWSTGFTDDEMPDQRAVSWTKLYIESFAAQITGILTDSHTYKLNLERTFGLPPNLVTTVYSAVPVIASQHFNATGRPRVLWAGRFDRQKRPDRLIKLAKRLPHVDFEVWGRPYLEHAAAIERQLAIIPNIHLRGGFNGFAQLFAQDRYNAFIYTAQWDGIPLVVLEAIAAGLPVVTTDSGGVIEAIDNTTGWLIPQADGPAAFVAAVSDCLNNPAIALEKARLAKERLLTQHSTQSFIATLQSVGLLSTTKQIPNSLQ